LVVEKRLYLRSEHGSHPVFVKKAGLSREYTIRIGGEVKIYRTTRALLRWLYGKTVYISHDRYFRVGQYSRFRNRTTSLLALFHELPGIDLENRSHEVSKILFRCYGNSLSQLNMDMEDVLQEVFKGILTRNKGTCAWDPQKSSFGHYVHMVCGCVLMNLQKKQKRRTEKEVVGVRTFSDDSWEWKDAAESVEGSYTTSPIQEEFEIGESVKDLQGWLLSREDARKTDNKIARKIIPLLCQGYKRSEIADSLEMDPGKVSRGLHYLRSVTTEWTGELAGKVQIAQI